MSLALLVLLMIYVINICLLIYGFTKVKKYQKTNLTPQTNFTVIVPFRNEAENLPKLLESFSNLNYPNDLFEVILVDDDSGDNFRLPVINYQLSFINSIRVSNSPKKDAISTAMQRVKTNWVITTDADCIVPVNWLLMFDNFIQENPGAMLAGAVSYDCKNSFLDYFQQLDITSLQGATIGSFGLKKPFMCNGANFAYTKSLFEKLNGFEGNNKIASGDDVFLLQKAVDLFPDEVHYLKAEEAIVITKPTETWEYLFHQRVRWAAKTSSYKSTFGKFLGLIVFFGNLSFVICAVSFLSGILPFRLLAVYAILKFSVDFALLYISNQFLTKIRIKYFLLSSIFYPFFSSAVVLYSFFGAYEWKDRRFKV